MSSKSWESTGLLLVLAFLPLILIGILIVGWLVVGVFWIASLLINIVTILIGGFVIIPIEWIFLLADWILGWLGPFIAGYFTRTHFVNWLNNIYLLIGFVILGVVMDFAGIDLTTENSNKNSGKRSLKRSNELHNKNSSNKVKSSDLEKGMFIINPHDSTMAVQITKINKKALEIRVNWKNKQNQYGRFTTDYATYFTKAVAFTSTNSGTHTSRSSSIDRSQPRRSKVPRHQPTQSQGKPVGLLDAMRGGMELQEYLPQDVSEKLKESMKYMLDINHDLNTNEGRMRMDKMIQLQMNFEVLQQNWNKAKNLEARTVMEGIASKLNSSSIKPTGYNPQSTNHIHQAMLSTFDKMKLLSEGKQVDLEHPALGWIELEPIMAKITNGRINKVILQDHHTREFLDAIYSKKYPLRYHHTLKDLHSDDLNEVISQEYGCRGIPLAVARIEFPDTGIWFSLKTFGGMQSESRGKPTLVSTRPDGIMIHMMAKVGRKPDLLSKEEFDMAMGTLTQFMQNPVDHNIRIHFPMELVEGYLAEQVKSN